MGIIVHHSKKTITLPHKASANSLAETIFLHGLWAGVPLCSGLGKCGLCKVRFLENAPLPHQEEEKRFSPAELEQGWRLACLHPSAPCTIALAPPRQRATVHERIADIHGDFILAVDLGTTSIQATALVDDTVALRQTSLNPQTGLGSEVMSRLARATDPKRAKQLQHLVISALEEYVAVAEKTLQGKCKGLGISGNSAMTYILLGLDTASLATAPCTLSFTGNETRTIAPTLPAAYFPPLYAPFVGADISAGLAAIHCDSEEKFPNLLADLGTNGEFILSLSPTERVCASVPMGPALEGIGLHHGQTASPGVIYGFAASPGGIAPRRIVGESAPSTATSPLNAMTGTGYLSLTALLYANGVLDEQGLFQSGCTPLGSKLKKRRTMLKNEPAFAVTPNLIVPASDIEEILKVKAAFNLAVSTLLSAANLQPHDLAAIYIAGAMGEHVLLEDLETLGFFPPGVRSIMVKAGNTSLRGTELILTQPKVRLWLEKTPESMRVLDLASTTSFGRQYMERMRFTYVN